MPILLDPELEARIAERAKARGYTDPSEYVRELVRMEDRITRGERPVHGLEGTATRGYTTDQIMAMTRGED